MTEPNKLAAPNPAIASQLHIAVTGAASGSQSVGRQ
jgi:hypothetical protein